MDLGVLQDLSSAYSDYHVRRSDVGHYWMDMSVVYREGEDETERSRKGLFQLLNMLWYRIHYRVCSECFAALRQLLKIREKAAALGLTDEVTAEV
jgi:hypothetical protein